MKKYLGVVLVLILLGPVTALASPQGCTEEGDHAAVEDLRLVRQAFNQAIVEKDIEAIARVFHQNVILITGTDSDVYSGPDAQLDLWRGDFANADRAVYVRTPACIRVSSVAPVALEYGTWRGEREISEGDFAAGSYAAKWRVQNGQWRLESEVFATEACGGGFCPVTPGSD